MSDELDYQNNTINFERVSAQYDAVGRMKQEYQVEYPNPSTSTNDQYTFTYSHDLAGNLTSFNNGAAVGSSTAVPALSLGATYDGVSRLSLLQATNPSSWGNNTATMPEYLINLGSTSCPNKSYNPFNQIAYEQASETSTSGTPQLTLTESYDSRDRIASENAVGYNTSGSATDSFGVIAVTGTEQSGDTGHVTVSLTDTNQSSQTYGQVLATTSNVAWTSSSTTTSLVSALTSAINCSMSTWITASEADPDGSVSLSSNAANTFYGIEVNVTDTANKTPSFDFAFSSVSGGTGAANNNYQVYNYTVPPGGWAPNGNLLAYSDSVMGDWAFQYDTLNRLTVLAPSGNVPIGGYGLGCYAYDSFGNRTLDVSTYLEENQTISYENGCTGYSSSYYSIYNANNQVTTFNQDTYNPLYNPPNSGTSNTVQYDVAGNVINDGINAYVYDAEGRLCAWRT